MVHRYPVKEECVWGGCGEGGRRRSHVETEGGDGKKWKQERK